MKKLNKLSHSAASRYQTCPKSYQYHYMDKLRPKISSAALLFGTAVDQAIQILLKKDPTQSPESVFQYFWNFAEINGEKTYLPTCTDIAYSNSDGDKDLISQEHLEKLLMNYGPQWEQKLSNAIKRKEVVGFKYLSRDEKTLFNFYNWACLHTKGLLMLNAVREKILPRIKEVLSVQETVELNNALIEPTDTVDQIKKKLEEADKIIGFVDLVCKFDDIEKPVIFDFKTSSIDYETDAVLTNPQLTLYVRSLSDKYDYTRNAGFFVLHKRVIKNKKKVCANCNYDGSGQRHKTCNNEIEGKRCNGEWKETIDPEIKVQIITGEIPTQTEDVILENFDYINEAIKNGVFSRNLQSCVMPYGKCAYYNKCYKGDDSDLVSVEKKDE